MGNCGFGEIKMSVIAKIYDNRNNKMYDVGALISNVSIASYLEEQPSKCTFDIIGVSDLKFYEGATVSIKIDGSKVFKGFVFSRKFTKASTRETIISVTAYDQLRYLKNKDSNAFTGKTSSEIMKKICKEYVLKYKIADESTYVCPSMSFDDKTLYEMIQTALDYTLINTGKRFIIWDNFGVLTHSNVLSLDTKLFIGDESLLYDFEYETSIDSDVYNQIKLYRDNSDTGKREVYIVNDTATKGSKSGQNLKEWGILQLTKKVDDNLNAKQIENLADNMLALYNNVKRTLKLECIGNWNVRAGSIIYCRIPGIEKMGKVIRLLVDTCTHKIDGAVHTMSLTVEVVKS